jgi:hypothetical protein
MIGLPSRNIPFTTSCTEASSPTAAKNRYPSSRAARDSLVRSADRVATWRR